MSSHKQVSVKLNEANLRKLSEPTSRQSPDNPTVACSRGSTSSASSKGSSDTSQRSSFWGSRSSGKSSSTDSYSSHEDQVRIRYDNITYRRTRPSVSSNFSFPPTPKRSLSPALSSIKSSETVFAESLGLDIRRGPVIVLMRHCHAESNYEATRNSVLIPDHEGTKIKDPPLSDRGKAQAAKLKDEYTRILENTKRAGELLGEYKDIVEIRPELQEAFGSPCDTGKAPQEQEAEFPGFDYSRCTPEVNVKKGIYSIKAKSICANAVLKKLKKRPEPILFLITHGHTIVELVDNRHWKKRNHANYQRNGEASVYAFHDDSTKLHPVSEKYAAKILGKPA